MATKKKADQSTSKRWGIKIFPGTSRKSVRLAVSGSGEKVITVKGKRVKLSDYVDESILTRTE